MTSLSFRSRWQGDEEALLEGSWHSGMPPQSQTLPSGIKSGAGASAVCLAEQAHPILARGVIWDAISDVLPAP